ncbi:MAG: TerC family protein [Candidatus Aminicenantes bacterium]|nr:TerC family protein [Candidatus Aminicenantes bacterium]
MIDTLLILLLIIGLELILGIDNVLVIAILVERLPETHRDKARILGLILAMFARIGMLWLVFLLSSLTQSIILNLSIRDIILILGGFFLIAKAVREIHHTVEFKEKQKGPGKKIFHNFYNIILQIVLLDIVFSIDSVITALGLTKKMWIIVIAVVFSFMGIMFYSKPLSQFIIKRPTIKILALAFLITIGVTLFLEGLHEEIPKAYIYIPMGFALMVELLQMRYEHNLGRKQKRLT